MHSKYQNKSSFRDPSGSIFEIDDRVFRGIKNSKSEMVKEFLDSNFYKTNAGSRIVKTTIVDNFQLNKLGLSNEIISNFSLWVEHEKIDFITYPYEWSFNFLKTAAIFHLSLQIDAIKSGYQLKDFSSFNVQFIGCEPIFIDLLSFEPYVEGNPWVGYKQFCEHFLSPILLNSYLGVEHQQWLRGSVDGIDLVSVSKLLPFSSYLNPLILGHVHLQARMMKKIDSSTNKKNKHKNQFLKKNNLIALLESLERGIKKFSSKQKTYWKTYENKNSYVIHANTEKEKFVNNFVSSFNLKTVLDVGCNTGHFSEIAFNAGAKRVIGLDSDGNAIDEASTREKLVNRFFTPLQYDFINPSPSLGWNLEERKSLKDRLPSIDGVICLALIHHLVIGKNIPLKEFINWLLEFGQYTLVEFVPKKDPMVQGLLKYREDVFEDYNEENFINIVSSKATIISTNSISESSRKLFVIKK